MYRILPNINCNCCDCNCCNCCVVSTLYVCMLYMLSGNVIYMLLIWTGAVVLAGNLKFHKEHIFDREFAMLHQQHRTCGISIGGSVWICNFHICLRCRFPMFNRRARTWPTLILSAADCSDRACVTPTITQTDHRGHWLFI